MNKIILIITLLLCSLASAQWHRFHYDLVIRKNTDTVRAKTILDVSEGEMKFYDEAYIEADSLRKTGQNIQVHTETDQLLIRKKGSFHNKTFYAHGYDYFVISSEDKINWKIQKETKELQGIILQKATAQYGGRDWIAWFTMIFPIQEGPYKFRGLPVLIIELYDSEKRFHYWMTKSINLPQKFDTSDFLEVRYGKKPIPISLKQYHKIKLDSYHNVVKELGDFVEKGNSIASDKELNTKESILKEKREIQQRIKNYHFPLEKDKAIPYP